MLPMLQELQRKSDLDGLHNSVGATLWGNRRPYETNGLLELDCGVLDLHYPLIDLLVILQLDLVPIQTLRKIWTPAKIRVLGIRAYVVTLCDFMILILQEQHTSMDIQGTIP